MVPSVSVVVPTLNAGKEIAELLDSLLAQSLTPIEILIVDSSSEDATQETVRSYDDGAVDLVVIDRSDFDHGLTRDMALRRTSGEYVLFMTQDAVPATNQLIEKIVAPMQTDDLVSQVTARQLPKQDARPFERLVRAYNYPGESNVREIADIGRLGVKTFYSSDVCCCYRRSAYCEVGGFTKTDMSEDMLMSCRLIRAEYKVAYAADAQVYHSHNFNPVQQYKRNHAVGAFLERNAAELDCGSEVGEGTALVKHVSMQLFQEKRLIELGAFAVDCAARLLGNRAGRARARKSMKKGGRR